MMQPAKTIAPVGEKIFPPSIEMALKCNLLFLPDEKTSLPMNPPDAEGSTFSFQNAMFPN